MTLRWRYFQRGGRFPDVCVQTCWPRSWKGEREQGHDPPESYSRRSDALGQRFPPGVLPCRYADRQMAHRPTRRQLRAPFRASSAKLGLGVIYYLLWQVGRRLCLVVYKHYQALLSFCWNKCPDYIWSIVEPGAKIQWSPTLWCNHHKPMQVLWYTLSWFTLDRPLCIRSWQLWEIALIRLGYLYFDHKRTAICRTIGSNQVMICPGAQTIYFLYIRLSSLRIRPQT